MNEYLTSAASVDADLEDFTLVDAQAAYSGVSALVELLSACPPGHQVTGIFIHSLLVDVRMHLENVVDNLRPHTVAHVHQAPAMQ